MKMVKRFSAKLPDNKTTQIKPKMAIGVGHARVHCRLFGRAVLTAVVLGVKEHHTSAAISARTCNEIGLLPFGAHKPPSSVMVVDEVTVAELPDADTFLMKYVRDNRPLIVRGGVTVALQPRGHTSGSIDGGENVIGHSEGSQDHNRANGDTIPTDVGASTETERKPTPDGTRHMWSDSYLAAAFGDASVSVEPGRHERRVTDSKFNLGFTKVLLRELLDRYTKEDIYSV
jgi:hypothetical protein